MLHHAPSAHSNCHQSSSHCTQSCHTMARQRHHQSLPKLYYAMLHSTPSAHSNCCQSGLPPCSTTQHHGTPAPPSIPVTTASCHAALHPERLQQPLPKWSTTVPCHATHYGTPASPPIPVHTASCYAAPAPGRSQQLPPEWLPHHPGRVVQGLLGYRGRGTGMGISPSCSVLGLTRMLGISVASQWRTLLLSLSL